MFNHESKRLQVEGRFSNETSEDTSEDGSQRTNKGKRAGKHSEASVTLGGIRGAGDPQPMKVQSVTLKGRVSLAMNLSGGQRRRLREEERGRATRHGRAEGLSSECDAAAEASPGT